MSTTERMQTTIDHATSTITFQRAFTAPREDVFEAWTQPDQLAEWWDPTGARLSECTIDLKPGGAFKFVNEGAHSPPFAGVYLVIERPALLVFDVLGSVGTVRLDTDRDTTKMTVTIRCSSAEHLAQFVKLGVDVGTDRTLDNLVAYVATRRS